MGQLREQLKAEQEGVDELTQTMEEQKDAFSALEEEHQLSLETISRLEARVSERDTDAASLSSHAGQLERENEVLRDTIGRLEKDRGREVDEQSRELSELAARESESRRQLESVVSEKAESEILVNSLQNRVSSFEEEVGRLRRQVHELQQESAAKEVTVAQLNKWRDQDKEDIKGLNIALDSKQQELELVRPFSLHSDPFGTLLTTLFSAETQDRSPRYCWEHTGPCPPQTRSTGLQHALRDPPTFCLV